MTLPKLETPTFKLKVPSTGKTIEFRPFVVKEEKLLLMLGDEDKQRDKSDLIKKLLSSCILSNTKIEDLTTFDIEYIFINLRSKSVGEEVDVMLMCEECGEKCPVTINLDTDVFISGKKPKDVDFNIPINTSVGFEMQYPTVDVLSDSIDNNDTVGMIIKCIKGIYDETTVHKAEDYTEKEMREFVESLSIRDIKKLQTFFDELPKVKCRVKFTCPHCGHENETELEGIGNFF